MRYTDEMIKRYPELASLRAYVCSAVEAIVASHKAGGKVLVAGNGGSAADAEHISGELLKGFLLKRTPCGDELDALSSQLGADDASLLQRGIAAIPLTSLSSALSAYANDVSPSLVYAQLTYALGRPGDVLICLSTSGNSENVTLAAKTARALGIFTVALTGSMGGRLAEICDVTVKAPATETFKVQEYHLPIYHAICADAEDILFS